MLLGRISLQVLFTAHVASLLLGHRAQARSRYCLGRVQLRWRERRPGVLPCSLPLVSFHAGRSPAAPLNMWMTWKCQ